MTILSDMQQENQHNAVSGDAERALTAVQKLAGLVYLTAFLTLCVPWLGLIMAVFTMVEFVMLRLGGGIFTRFLPTQLIPRVIDGALAWFMRHKIVFAIALIGWIIPFGIMALAGSLIATRSIGAAIFFAVIAITEFVIAFTLTHQLYARALHALAKKGS
jgi:hypothetical protein